MKNILFFITVFFALMLSSLTVAAAQTTVSISSAVEENHTIRVVGRVNNPVENQRLVIMGCAADDYDGYVYSDDIYMNNIAAPLDNNGNFTLTLELDDHISIRDDSNYVIRIGGSNIDSPAVIMLSRSTESGVVILGDVNIDGRITADDAALTLQYVLFGMSYISDEQVAAMRVTATDIITADSAANILMKVLDASYVFPVNR